MSRASLHYLPGQDGPAQTLAAALGIEARPIHVRRFPDGESLVRVERASETVIVHATLDQPNSKLIELVLAAGALRDGGAERLVLMAPYLCYMRQDMAFHPGEAVSQRIVGQLMAQRFDRIVTVDPHLHRTHDLASVFPGINADALTATGLIAALLRADAVRGDTIIVGPDAESRQWAGAVAGPLGLDVLVGEKQRHGDRDVVVTVKDAERAAGRPVIIVDDVVSSGMTVARCAEALAAAGASSLALIAVHALVGAADQQRLRQAGIADFRSSDSVAHPSNAFSLTPLLAAALEGECR